jgi:N-acetylmuramoyl-L-alanine amidase CwlA
MLKESRGQESQATGWNRQETEDRKFQEAQAKKDERKSASVREKEAEAKRAKLQAETEQEREGRKFQDAQAKKDKRKSASVRQKEAEAKRAKLQAETEEERGCRITNSLCMWSVTLTIFTDATILAWHAGYVLYEL